MIRVANAPCSWGVLEFGLEGETADWRQFMSELVESGYRGTELGDPGFLPDEPDALADALAEFGLPLVGAFVPVALADRAAHDDGRETALRTARLVSAVAPDALIVLADDNGTVEARTRRAGRISPGDGLDDGAWTTFVDGTEQIARAVRDETGLRTVFHHHCGGWIETPAETARLLDATDPDLVGLCFDTGHWTFGGGDALEGLRRHRDRVWHVHFKDCDADVAAMSRGEELAYFGSVQNGVFCELGHGAVDFDAVLSFLRDTDYDGWIVVEQDVLPGMGTPLESAFRNREFLRKLGL